MREKWIDNARGIAILYVVLCHLAIPEFINAYIYSFHVPLLLFISGWLFNSKGEALSFLRKKFRTIVLPFLFLRGGETLSNLIKDLVCLQFDANELVGSLYDTFIAGNLDVYWYLQVLLWVNILFYFLDKKFKRNFAKIWIISILLFCCGLIYDKYIGVVLPWRIELTLTAQLFFLTGYYFRSFDFANIKVNKKVVILIMCICHLACLALTYGVFGYIINVDLIEYGIAPLSIIMALCGVLVYLEIAKRVDNKVVEYIGKNSLIFYAWHPIFFGYALTINNHTLHINGTLLLLWQYIFSILMCTIFTEIIYKTKLRVCLGR